MGGRERNWAGNVVFGASRWHEPATLTELREVVRTGRRVRVVGSRHSFSTIADTDGDAVSMVRMRDVVDLDPDARTVTVEAGITYGELAPFLHDHGWALANMASLPQITVAGAVATGTHGSGVGNGNLATAVRALQLVTADGDVVDVSRDRQPSAFDAMVVGMGAFGIVSRVTLRVEPAFDVAQRVHERLPMAATFEQLDRVMASGYSTCLFTTWQGDTIEQLWCKRRLDGPDASADDDDALFGGALATRPRHPIAGIDAASCTEQLGRPGPWHERLPHFRPDAMPSSGDELQSELFVAAGDGAAAMRALVSLRDDLAAVLKVSEVRAVAADELWLSPCHRRETIALHFTWAPSWPAVRPVLERVEAALAPFAPRPHWGKLSTMSMATIGERYERMADFAALVAEWDPAGRFRNAYIDELLAAS